MKGRYATPEYWRDVPVLEGLILASIILFGSVALVIGVSAKIWTGSCTVLDALLGSTMAYVLGCDVLAMHRGYILRKDKP